MPTDRRCTNPSVNEFEIKAETRVCLGCARSRAALFGHASSGIRCAIVDLHDTAMSRPRRNGTGGGALTITNKEKFKSQSHLPICMHLHVCWCSLRLPCTAYPPMHRNMFPNFSVRIRSVWLSCIESTILQRLRQSDVIRHGRRRRVLRRQAGGERASLAIRVFCKSPATMRTSVCIGIERLW